MTVDYQPGYRPDQPVLTLFRHRVTGSLVEAVQYGPDNGRAVFEWAPGKQHHTPAGVDGMNVDTPEGRRHAAHGDWILREAGTDRFWVAPVYGFDDDYVQADAGGQP